MAFFAGAACSGAMTLVLSDASEAEAVAGAGPVTSVSAVMAAGPGATALGATGGAALGDEVFAEAEAGGEDRSGGAAAAEARGDAGFARVLTVTGSAVGAGEVAMDGTAAARTLVTIARPAIGLFSGSPGRSIRESTTPAPAVAPIAVATKTTRAVRAKLGAGAK